MVAAEGAGVGNILAHEGLWRAGAGAQGAGLPMPRAVHAECLADPADADAHGQLADRAAAGRMGAAADQHVAVGFEGGEIELAQGCRECRVAREGVAHQQRLLLIEQARHAAVYR